jgi:CRP-like cAMP-binding protein
MELTDELSELKRVLVSERSHVERRDLEIELSEAWPRATERVINGVRYFALFADLTPTEFEQVISAAREKSYALGETIFTEGDAVSQVIMVVSGFVKVTQTGVSGGEVILRLSGPGEIVGSYRVSSHLSHAATAQAVQSCAVLVWEAAKFENLMAQIPTLRRNAVRALEKRLLEMEQRLQEVSTKGLESRLSNELFRIARQDRSEGKVEIALSREDLAKLTGATLFDVNRLLAAWQAKGIVAQHKDFVELRDISALTNLTQ